MLEAGSEVKLSVEPGVEPVIEPVIGGEPAAVCALEAASGPSPGPLAIAPSRLTVLMEKVADRLGICLSALCVVHCLLTPFVLLLLPSVQLLSLHESYHQFMLVILPALAVIAFIPGYRLHRERRIFMWAIPGLALIVLGALVFHDFLYLEIASSVLGSLFLIRAHLLNRVLCSCCEAGHVRHSGAFRPRKFRKESASKPRLLSSPQRHGRHGRR